MSSLCPLPIGNIESIATIPVFIGVSTDCLFTIPGAGVSIGLYPSALIGPFPSIGLPSESTTLPRKSSPTGTPAVFLVRLTRLPSDTSSSLPNRMIPTSSDLRSCTIPLTPESNITISPYSTDSSPLATTIPSPTELTCPSSSAIGARDHSSIELLISVTRSGTSPAGLEISYLPSPEKVPPVRIPSIKSLN